MRARAFEKWAEKLTDWDVQVHQTLESTHPLYRFGVEVYNVIQRRAPRLHHAYFNFLEFVSAHRRARSIIGAQRFKSVVREMRPHIVLSTHAHLNHGFFELARRTMAPEPLRCVTYCGELSGGYGFSRHWVSRRVDLFIGAVDATTRTARAYGLAPERTATGGFLLPVAAYDSPESPDERRAFLAHELGLDPDAFTLVLATGAAGANNHIKLLDALHEADLPDVTALQCIALCGRNARTLEVVNGWAAAHPELPVKPLPYWPRMSLLLRASSAVVARPGSGLASESTLCGCPLILNGMGGVMPQERLTSVYMTEQAGSRRIWQARDLVPIVREWISDPEAHARAQRGALSARPTLHPKDVLELVAGRPLDGSFDLSP